MDIAALRAEQLAPAGKVIRHDAFAFSQPGLIAGTDVGFEQGGEVIRAAITLLHFPSLELVNEAA